MYFGLFVCVGEGADRFGVRRKSTVVIELGIVSSAVDHVTAGTLIFNIRHIKLRAFILINYAS